MSRDCSANNGGRMFRYVVHTCPARRWYVDEFLLPSMLAQGIGSEEVLIWDDALGHGNLLAFMESARACGRLEHGAWHLQDDVLLCRDFAARTRQDPDLVACGFCCEHFGPIVDLKGRLPVKFLWYSFQCIWIPHDIAAELADWFFQDARFREAWADKVSDRKHDDWFFRQFLLERHPEDSVLNIAPSLVDHVDYLLGGSIINRGRIHETTRAAFFEDGQLAEELRERLEARDRSPGKSRAAEGVGPYGKSV